jgi:hypothetical protein
MEELEERLRRRGSQHDSGRSLPLPMEDDDDHPPPAVVHTNVTPADVTGFIVAFPIVPETPPHSLSPSGTSDPKLAVLSCPQFDHIR